MQRALFLIEGTGERISALLNPERLVLTRRSGVESMEQGAGLITGAGLSDDLLLATGGGTTELVLDLLFDIDLAETGRPANAAGAETAATAGTVAPVVEQPIEDVRELTRPLWNLAENTATTGRRARLPIVRFIWGRSWNLPGVITDVAERFERIDDEGRPRRSFLRLKLRRIAEPDADETQGTGAGSMPGSVTPFYEFPDAGQNRSLDAGERIELEVDDLGIPGKRWDFIAFLNSGDPALWRHYTASNDIDDPYNLDPGTLIALPPVQSGGSA